jgi:hypothetical protein
MILVDRPMQNATKVRARAATVDDYAAVNAVCTRNGLHTRPLKDWKHIWEGCPFRTYFNDFPTGWVLETASGEIVGSFTNIPSLYEWNGQTLRAAIASSWAVDPDYRGSSLALAAQFFRQKGVELLINSTANPTAAPLMNMFKAERIPHHWYNRSWLWVTGYAGFVQNALSRSGLPNTGLLEQPLAFAMRARDAVMCRRINSSCREVIAIKNIDERFDRFWEKRKDKSKELLAYRNRDAMRWRFQSQIESGKVVILAFEDHQDLTGYIVLRRTDPSRSLKRFFVLDLQTLDTGPELTQALMAGAVRLARNQGVHWIELMGFNNRKRDALVKLGPYTLKNPGWRFFYRAQNAELRSALRVNENWEPSPFDGDEAI